MLQKALAVITLGLIALPGFAADAPVYTGFFGNTAIKGYDTVAYFTQGKAVEGNKSFSVEHRGAKWMFASAANRDLFAKNPEKYVPQYGGYCAFALGSYNDLVKVDPEAWKIVDGKLYLNYNHKIQEKWEADQASLIATANKNWPGHIK